jgi:RNA polymerase sigma factor (sigma-70 family)
MGIAQRELAAESDTALVAGCRAGDREAFARLIERYQSLVCAVAYSCTGDLALSEDVGQEVFLVAWRSLGELRDPEKVRGWLAGIGRNVARNARRRARPWEPLERAGEVHASDRTPLEHALAREEEMLLSRALAEVPEAYREPLVLFYREGQSVAQVAVALDLSEDAVKQRLARARAMLRAQVAAFVEGALARTRPGKAFTVAVLAALPAALPGSAAAAAVAAAAKAAPTASAGATSAGLAGVVAGPLIGILGGYLGARASIENTRSPRERAFMKRMVWVCLAYVGAFLVVEALAAAVAPSLWGSVYGQLTLWGLYAAGLVSLINSSNRRQHAIQVEDGTAPPPPPVAPASRSGVYGSLGGGVFGAVCWLFPMCFIAGDWLLAVLTAAVAAVIFAVGARRALAAPERYDRIAMKVFLALGVWNVVLVNLHWERWMIAFRQTPFADTSIELPLWMMNVLLVAVIAHVLLGFYRTERAARRQPLT